MSNEIDTLIDNLKHACDYEGSDCVRVAELALKEHVAKLEATARTGELIRNLPAVLEYHNSSECILLLYTVANGWEVLASPDTEDLSDAMDLSRSSFITHKTPDAAIQSAISKMESDIKEAKSFFGESDDEND